MFVRSDPAAGVLPRSAMPRRAAGSYNLPSLAPDTDPPASNPVAFGLFLLLNAVLFMRPYEIFPDLADVPIYYFVILPCILASLPALLFRVLTFRSLAEQPISVCVLALLPLSVFSMLGKLTQADMQTLVWEFAKVLVYYVLLIANVSTPLRIRQFLGWLVVFITVLTGIAVLQWEMIIDLGLKMCQETAPDPTGSGLILYTYRLQATGVFNDPNDLCLALGLGTALCLYKYGDRGWGTFRVLWLTPIALFGYALYLTKSRGGLLAVVVGILVLLIVRLGWKKGLVITVLCSPLLLLLAGSRQGDMEIGGGTGQQRVQYWSAGFILLKESPVRGIGFGQFVEQVGHVAHNSYVHSFVELGFFGGAMFVGAFYLATWSIYRLGKKPTFIVDPDMLRLRPLLLGAVAAYATGMFSLSRCYVVPTYMVLGLAAVYIRAAVPSGVGLARWNFGLMLRLLVVGFLVLTSLYLFVRVFVQFT
jgi:putative inorganic carbon (HCO3(-)) transporter